MTCGNAGEVKVRKFPSEVCKVVPKISVANTKRVGSLHLTRKLLQFLRLGEDVTNCLSPQWPGGWEAAMALLSTQASGCPCLRRLMASSSLHTPLEFFSLVNSKPKSCREIDSGKNNSRS